MYLYVRIKLIYRFLIFKRTKQFYAGIEARARDDRVTATIRRLPSPIAPASWEPYND